VLEGEVLHVADDAL
jgi:hypothetical protein